VSRTATTVTSCVPYPIALTRSTYRPVACASSRPRPTHAVPQPTTLLVERSANVLFQIDPREQDVEASVDN
jgi:hypothetical protein